MQKVKVYQVLDALTAGDLQTKYRKTLPIFFNSDLKDPVSLYRSMVE